MLNRKNLKRLSLGKLASAPGKISVLLAALCAAAWLGTACEEVKEPQNPVYQTGLTEKEYSTAAIAKQFPQEYALYLQNNDSGLETMTDFGGSVPYRKNDNVNPLPEGYKYGQPYLKNLWLGYPFSYEYNAARGHTYAIHDILHIDRINRYDEKAGLPATCWNCKTTKIPTWLEEYGDDFWAMDFNKFRDEAHTNMVDESIGCSYCHDPANMELRISSVPLKAALEKSLKVNLAKASRNEMRSYVCAQCHVEYYFAEPEFGPNKMPVFPWANGREPEEMYQYYKGHGPTKGPNVQPGFEGQFVDFVHPVSKVPILKAQHPEFETWYNGPHGAAGVSCSDCHMEYVRLEGKRKIANHHWRSPLKNIEGSCRQCHSDKTADYLKDQVVSVQEKVFAQLLTAQELSVKAHEAIRLAREWPGHDQEALIEAKELAREGQFYWDLISAENSVGFHNPAKALNTLALSQQASQKAVNAALRATNWQTAADIDGDIYAIVPPILKHSRELQMDPEHMSSHTWLTYLPTLKKSERVWDEQKRLIPAPDEAGNQG